jgi:hypothetical protein
MTCKYKVVLPKRTGEVHFMVSLNTFSVSASIIRAFTNLDKGSLPVSPNWSGVAVCVCVCEEDKKARE